MHNLRVLIFGILVFFSNALSAQNTPFKLEIDQLAFTFVKDSSVQREIVKSLTGFLQEKNNGSLSNPYIDPAYLKTNIEPFQYIQDIEMSGGTPFFYPTLLRAIPIEGKSILLKIAYMGVGGEASIPYLRIIATLIAKKNDKGSFYFYNALDHYTRNWSKSQCGTIKYIYDNKLNLKKADAMDKFNLSFSRKLNTAVLKITYYKFEDPEQMFKIMGYDFLDEMYASPIRGLAQYWNNTVFAGNNSEMYEHEVVHFYTYIVFPKGTKNVHEGYATFIGVPEEEL